MGFKEQFAKLRKRKNITQVDLANIMGVKQYVVSSWETGRSEPNITQITKLSDVFEVPLDYLLDKPLVRAASPEDFKNAVENVHLDSLDDFLASVQELCGDLSQDKKKKMLEIIKASINFEK